MEQQPTKLVNRTCARARCGHLNRPGARFCARCGDRFDPPKLSHLGALAAACGVMFGLAVVTTALLGAKLTAAPIAAVLVIGVVVIRRNGKQEN